MNKIALALLSVFGGLFFANALTAGEVLEDVVERRFPLDPSGTFSLRARSTSAKRSSRLSVLALARISPCGPATKLEPQNWMPRPPAGAASNPVRLHASSGKPFATA